MARVAAFLAGVLLAAVVGAAFLPAVVVAAFAPVLRPAATPAVALGEVCRAAVLLGAAFFVTRADFFAAVVADLFAVVVADFFAAAVADLFAVVVADFLVADFFTALPAAFLVVAVLGDLADVAAAVAVFLAPLPAVLAAVVLPVAALPETVFFLPVAFLAAAAFPLAARLVPAGPPVDLPADLGEALVARVVAMRSSIEVVRSKQTSADRGHGAAAMTPVR